MRTLAIECATEACSAALFADGELVAGRFEAIGRGHAERLVPMIGELPENGRAERILVSLGPGSFTGVRVGLAAARGLALAWRAQCLGYPTLALVAAMAQERSAGAVTVCMNGGHGEWFVQDFAADGTGAAPLESLPPAEAAQRACMARIAGNRSTDLAAAMGGAAHCALDILPDARQALLVPSGLLTSDLTPLYGRAPDARLPQVPA